MKKLNSYMKRNKITIRRLSERLGVADATVFHWVHGTTKPGVVLAIRLEKLTRGAVSVYDWK